MPAARERPGEARRDTLCRCTVRAYRSACSQAVEDSNPVVLIWNQLCFP